MDTTNYNSVSSKHWWNIEKDTKGCVGVAYHSAACLKGSTHRAIKGKGNVNANFQLFESPEPNDLLN